MLHRTWATSSHHGFLARNLDVIPAVKIEYSVNTASSESGQTYDAPSGFLIVTPVHDDGAGLRRGDVDGSKWDTRGWVMQERSLSTRTIHFCKNKIYFECRNCLKSEENEPEQVRLSDPFQPWPRSLAENDPAKWYEHWKRAVICYSRRRLTVPSDKLTAIQSLANEMAAHVPAGSYIPEAAMWSGNMERELLWHVESGIARRPATKRAPTWSWASLDANIGYVQGMRLVDCPTPKGLSPIRFQPHSPYMIFYGNQMDVMEIRPNDEERWTSASRFPYDIIGPADKLFARGMLDFDNRNSLLPIRPGDSLCYLHVSNNQKPSGLLLKHTSRTRSHRIWERVGVATIFEISGEVINPEGWGDSCRELFQDIIE